MDKVIEIPIKEKEIINGNILKATVGTNGYCGGDKGHGSITYLKFEDIDGTFYKVNKLKNGFEILLGGDSELETFIESLKFAYESLKKLTEESISVKVIKDTDFKVE